MQPHIVGIRPSWQWLGALAAALTCSMAAAQTSDLDALRLADTPPPPSVAASDWHWFAEIAAGQVCNPVGTHSNQRLSLDLQLDKSLAPGWRGVLANRLDLDWPAQYGTEHRINTLKEAYVGWQPTDAQALDLGRINARFGVATGYNPTDYFRTNSLRSLVSVDPNSLKKNRQGAFMLRGQTLWADGALTALLSPRLARLPKSAPFALNEGATNASNRWLLTWSQRLSERLNPQWLLYGEERKPPQIGFNLAALANDATVVFMEWSGGRGRSQVSQALGWTEDQRFQQRLSTGITYTTGHKLSLTLEYSSNSAAPAASQWSDLQSGSPWAYALYRSWTQSAQELTTRQQYALSMNWPDALAPHLDLSAMVRFNGADHSRLHWLEARYHWTQTDLALQWQSSSGTPRSDFGAAPRTLQVSVRRYF
ncbi:hypothetical protein [Simplicispira piscis]